MKTVSDKNSSKRGVSLIGVAVFIIVLGMVMVVGMQIHNSQKTQNKLDVTATHIEEIQEALKNFKSKNRRFPAPAPINVRADDAGFGQEISLASATDSGAVDGTKQAPGRGGRIIRTGTIPVRTLGLSDDLMQDGYGNRIVYAVTQDYVFPPGKPKTDPDYESSNVFNYDRGAISVVDSGLNNSGVPTSVTSSPGNAIYVIVAHGTDIRGAYSNEGADEKALCSTDPVIGENCYSDNDGVFTNSIAIKGDQDQNFSSKVLYESSQDLYGWIIGDWDISNCICPEDLQTRLVQCKKGKKLVVDDVFCKPPYGIGKPLTEQSCALPPASTPSCYWAAGDWGECSVGCGGGNQSRSVNCVRADGFDPPDPKCDPATRPGESQSCNTHSCGGGPGPNCGNGVCDAGEDMCNCSDCPAVGCDSGSMYQVDSCDTGAHLEMYPEIRATCCCETGGGFYPDGTAAGHTCPPGGTFVHSCSGP